jgi:hypothetical protein
MTARYDRDVKWPWGKYKKVPVSCIPLEYLAWFVQNGTDRVWMGLIERELLCRKLGDKAMHSKTKFNTPEKVLDELAMNEFRKISTKSWLQKPVVDSWYNTHGPGNKKLKAQRQAEQKAQNKNKAAKSQSERRTQSQAKPITTNTITTNTIITTGSYKTPTHDFNGSPIDPSKPPF